MVSISKNHHGWTRILVYAGSKQTVVVTMLAFLLSVEHIRIGERSSMSERHNDDGDTQSLCTKDEELMMSS